MGVQRRNVPHFKGLINAKVDLGAQGRDTTFILCHAQLRKPILLLEMAKGAVSFAPYCTFKFMSQTPTTKISSTIEAVKTVLKEANIALMEPMMKLVINAEPSVVSNLINDLFMRRGQVLERKDISAG